MKINRGFYYQYTRIAIISIEWLKDQNIQGVILDLDNTIVSEDDRFLSPDAETWLKQAKNTGIRFFILSNGKRRERFQYWSDRLNIPGINPAHKPSPKNFRRALHHLQLAPKQVVVLGDSLHTDVIGGWFLGCHIIQVASLPHPPRWWEKLFGKWVQIPYPLAEELWLVKTS